MAFTNSFRMERVYFERLKSMIDILKPYLNTETDEKIKSILENSIDDNGAILLLYRNLGECWAELSDLIKKADEKIDSLDDKTEKYHDELNERIDEVNNYIMQILREIDARLEVVEQDLATLSRNIILDLERVNDDYTLSYKGDSVDFAQLAEWVEFPDNVIVRGVVNGEETVFHLREFDTDETSGVFEFFATGLIDNVVHEITVTVLPDDSVNVATDIQTIPEYTAGDGISIQGFVITNTAPGITYTAGAGIEIDAQNNQIDVGVGTGLNIDATDNLIKNTGLFPLYDDEEQYYYKANAMQTDDNYLPVFNHDYTAVSRNYINFNLQQIDYNLVTDDVVDLPYGYRIKFNSDIGNKILNASVNPFGSVNGNAVLDVEVVYKKTRRSDTQTFNKQYVVPFSIIMDSTFDITTVAKCLEIKLNEILDLSGLYGENIKTEFANFSISYKINIVGQLYFTNAHTLDSQIEIPNIVKAFNENPIYFYRLDRDY